MKTVCFRCGEIFSIGEQCEKCGWQICPHCGACLCSLSPREQFVAIAVWLSTTSIFVETPTKETWNKWYNKLKELKQTLEAK